MKLKKRDPHSPEVIDAAVEMIRKMTPEEALAFLTYRTPGVEETDMTGMLGYGQSPKTSVQAKRNHVSPVTSGEDETPLREVEEVASQFAGRTFSDSTKLLREDRKR